MNASVAICLSGCIVVEIVSLLDSTPIHEPSFNIAINVDLPTLVNPDRISPGIINCCLYVLIGSQKLCHRNNAQYVSNDSVDTLFEKILHSLL